MLLVRRPAVAADAERGQLVTARFREPGEFCWINILTPRPAEARAFFAQLLGWTYAEIPGMGHTIAVDGRAVGGLFDLASPQTPPGTPPLIGAMLLVDSADAAAARVTALGGSAMPPFDIGGQGRMAVCFDPNGAEFDVWEAGRHRGTDVDVRMHGAPSWFENVSSNVATAAGFYTALFEWETRLPPPGQAPPCTILRRGSTAVAGLAHASAGPAGSRPHWRTYFTVDDVETAARRAVELGGLVTSAPREIAGIGGACGLASPEGVGFHALSYRH